MKIKICGMREAENISAVAALDIDLMGFIFYRPSPRYVGPDFSLPATFPETILRTGVFVNEATTEIIRLSKLHRLDYAQLHGTGSPDQCTALRDHGIAVIRAFSVGPDFDFAATRAFDGVADYFLFDSKGKHHGGNGTAFDWSMLRSYQGDVPYFLSGGLTPENLPAALGLTLPGLKGFDMNSGVEHAPGVKDIERINNAVRLIRQN